MNIINALSEANIGFVYDKIKIEAAYDSGKVRIVSFIPDRIQHLFDTENMMGTTETEDENRGAYKFSNSIQEFISYLYTTIAQYAGESKVDKASFDNLGKELYDMISHDNFRNKNITTDSIVYDYQNRLTKQKYKENERPNWDYETYVVFKSGEKLISLEGVRRLNQSLYRKNTKEIEQVKPDKKLFSDPEWEQNIKKTAALQ